MCSGSAIAVISDIQQLKQTENALRQLSFEQSIILDNAEVGISYIQDRLLKWSNHSFSRMVGYSTEEMENVSTSMFVDAAEYEQIGKEAYPVLASGQAYTATLKMHRRDGTLFYARVTGKAVNPANPYGGCIWIISDETAQRELENKLQQSHSLLTTLSKQIPGTIYQYQLFPDGRSCFPYVSDSMIETYELTPEEVREDATPLYNHVHPEDKDRVIAHFWQNIVLLL